MYTTDVLAVFLRGQTEADLRRWWPSGRQPHGDGVIDDLAGWLFAPDGPRFPDEDFDDAELIERLIVKRTPQPDDDLTESALRCEAVCYAIILNGTVQYARYRGQSWYLMALLIARAEALGLTECLAAMSFVTGLCVMDEESEDLLLYELATGALATIIAGRFAAPGLESLRDAVDEREDFGAEDDGSRADGATGRTLAFDWIDDHPQTGPAWRALWPIITAAGDDLAETLRDTDAELRR
jgi:hypothetical protein